MRCFPKTGNILAVSSVYILHLLSSTSVTKTYMQLRDIIELWYFLLIFLICFSFI